MCVRVPVCAYLSMHVFVCVCYPKKNLPSSSARTQDHRKHSQKCHHYVDMPTIILIPATTTGTIIIIIITAITFAIIITIRSSSPAAAAASTQ